MLGGVARRLPPGLALVALAAAAAGCGAHERPASPPVRPAPPIAGPAQARVVTPRTWISRPRLGRVTARVPLPNGPTSVGFGPGGLWVTRDDGRLSLVDPRSNRVTRTTRTGRFPVGVAFAGGAAWVANSRDDTVSRVDARTGAELGTVRVGDGPGDVAASGRAVWVANGLDDTVTRLDSRTGRVADVLHVGPPPAGTRTIAAGPDGVWVTGPDVLLRIDPRSDRVVARTAVAGPSGPMLTHDSLWVASEDDGTVLRLDRRSGRLLAVVRVGSYPTFVAADDRFAWALNNGAGTVTQIDALTNRVVGTIPVGAHAFQVVLGGGSLWVQGYGGKIVTRIDPR
jgi:YVTN family beta-propeller protein